MLEIRDAILAGQFDTVGALDVPEHYRGVTVHADEAEMFAGMYLRWAWAAMRSVLDLLRTFISSIFVSLIFLILYIYYIIIINSEGCQN